MINGNQDEFMENCKKVGTDFLSPDFKPSIIDFNASQKERYFGFHPETWKERGLDLGWRDKETAYICFLMIYPYHIWAHVIIDDVHPLNGAHYSVIPWKKIGIYQYEDEDVNASPTSDEIVEKAYLSSFPTTFLDPGENSWNFSFSVNLKGPLVDIQKEKRALTRIKKNCKKLAKYLKSLENI